MGDPLMHRSLITSHVLSAACCVPVSAADLLGRQAWQFEREGRALAFTLAVREDAAAVLLGDRTHDEQAEARALHLVAPRLEAVEAREDPLQLRLRDADAAVAHAHPQASRLGRGHFDAHLHVLQGVLHGVVEQVRQRGAQLVGVAAHEERLVARRAC